MTLIDTSSWVEALRPKGRVEVRERVEALLSEGQASWCDAVRLELWNGRGNEREARMLRQLEASLESFPIDAPVWNLAISTARAARARGITVPAIDLLIFACARINDLDIESADGHFELLEAL